MSDKLVSNLLGTSGITDPKPQFGQPAPKNFIKEIISSGSNWSVSPETLAEIESIDRERRRALWEFYHNPFFAGLC